MVYWYQWCNLLIPNKVDFTEENLIVFGSNFPHYVFSHTTKYQLSWFHEIFTKDPIRHWIVTILKSNFYIKVKKYAVKTFLRRVDCHNFQKGGFDGNLCDLTEMFFRIQAIWAKFDWFSNHYTFVSSRRLIFWPKCIQVGVFDQNFSRFEY